MVIRKTHGDGSYDPTSFKALGTGCVFETGVMVFHPENISLGNDVYIGHQTILKGYHKNEMSIGSGAWIGQQCFLHSAGGIYIGENVGIGPGVRIITSVHQEAGRDVPILHSAVEMAAVHIEPDADIGVSSTILPGVTVGRGAQVGAGSVVTRSVPQYAVVAGAPAKLLRMRP